MQTLARIICRYCLSFLCIYWICFTFPFPLDLVGLPFQFVDSDNQPTWMKTAGEEYGQAYMWIYTQKDDVCKWLGSHVLNVDVIIQPTGSGDTMRAYVGCLCALVVAAAAALLWTLIRWGLSRWKPNWNLDVRLMGLVRVLVRFYLVQMFFGYGFAKVFPLQFSPPGPYRLAEQVGDMSPMGLLWTFMGFSPAYQIFTGAAEALAGILLTTRRTTLLGALVGFVVMLQVFALNMCFDVPVKLYSFHYLVMTLFLAAPELPRLFNVLVLGRAVQALPLAPLRGSVRFDRCIVLLRTLLVAAILAGEILSGYKRWDDTYGSMPLPNGSRWDVVQMQVDGKEPDKGDPLAWAWLEFSNKSILRITGPTPSPTPYRTTWKPGNNELTISKIVGPTSSGTFVYDIPETDKLELRGTMDGKALTAILRRTPEKKYQLMNRGFHWVQELPYNR
jgi:hypothetical protein